MTWKAMKLIDPSTGRMECKVCGSTHFGNYRESGHFHRGNWQCLNGCTKEDYAKMKAEERSIPT